MLTGYENDPLITQLRLREIAGEQDFWSFKSASVRKGAHALLHYPAMMVPSLQGLILESIVHVSPQSTAVLDPFVGSGTVLVEAMERGLDFDGVDINPLAGLACLAKSGPYFTDAFDSKKEQLKANILSDMRSHKPKEFKGMDKWFDPDVSACLAKIQFHIRNEPSLWARRLFWLALCRVVRATCNSRMSTYKLHIKSQEDDAERINPIFLYFSTLACFSQNLKEQQKKLVESGYLNKGRYIGNVGVEVADNTSEKSPLPVNKQYDIVMTSPPYGDNTTTIPYGQYAYLPLNWVDINDISPSIDNGLLANTHATDAASLGGSLKNAKTKKEELSDKYQAAKSFIEKLENNKNGINRFVSFFWDLEKSVQRIATHTRDGGYQSWTIGNRRIGGNSVPMETLLHEMLESQGVSIIGKIDRNIHKKKMASRNNCSETMKSEVILIARMDNTVNIAVA